MRLQNFLSLFIIAIFVSSSAFADSLSVSNINRDQADKLMDSLAADLAFRPLEPASTYGDYWGISGGITGVLTSASKVTQAIPSNTTKYLPGGEIYAGFQAPFGLAGEFGFLPKTTVKSVQFGKYAFGAKWTWTKMFLPISPVDMAVRVLLTRGMVTYQSYISGGTVNSEFDTTIWGFNHSFSMPLLWFFEPFVGIGYIHHSSTLNGWGTVNLFNSTVTANQSASRSADSLWLTGGVQFKILLLTLTAEYDRMFGVNSYAAKVGFKF